jgi:Na+-driven multidrug efflux pump
MQSSRAATFLLLLLRTANSFTAFRGLALSRGAQERASLFSRTESLQIGRSVDSLVCHVSSTSDDAETSSKIEQKPTASKRSMLKFAVPALGIFLASPLLSNIDNAFVGKTVGSQGLAALSPGTVCTDNLLYLFTFLSRATTGIVSRAFAAKNEESTEGDIDAAREAASAPLSVAFICGLIMTFLYAFFTPNLLKVFNVDARLRSDAASYIYWRGAVTWAALTQSIALSVLLATRDAVTPLKIVGLASVLNVIGDYLLCVWPMRWGCAGAAAATSGATLVSCGFLLNAMKKKRLLPAFRLPSIQQLRGLLDFTGPLLAITLTRLGGLIAMQKSAMALGVQPLAAYQMSINLIIFFLLFGEPLSQLSQTKLPSLIDSNNSEAVKATLKSVGVLSTMAAVGVGSVAFASVEWGSTLFSSDPTVQILSRQAAPAVFLTVIASILSVAIDGAMLGAYNVQGSCSLVLVWVVSNLSFHVLHSIKRFWVYADGWTRNIWCTTWHVK